MEAVFERMTSFGSRPEFRESLPCDFIFRLYTEVITTYCIRQATLPSNDLQYKRPPEPEGCLIVILQPGP